MYVIIVKLSKKPTDFVIIAIVTKVYARGFGASKVEEKSSRKLARSLISTNSFFVVQLYEKFIEKKPLTQL